ACEDELTSSVPNRGWALVRSCGVAHPGEKPEAGDLFDGYGFGACGEESMKARPVESLSRINPGLNLSESNFIFMRNVSNRTREWMRDIRVQTCPDQLACEVNQEYPKLVQMELPPDKCKIMPFFLRLMPGHFLTHSTGTLLDRRSFGKGALTVIHATRDEFTESCIVTPSGEWRTMPGLMAVPQSPNTTILVGRPALMPVMARCGDLLFALVSEKCAGEVWELSRDSIAFSNLQILDAAPDGTITARSCCEDFHFTWLSPVKKSLSGDFQELECRCDDDFCCRSIRGCFNRKPLIMPDFRRRIQDGDLILEAEITPEILDGLEELVLTVEFDGECGEAWLDDTLICDHYYGKFLPWEIGLKEWLNAPATLKIRMRECTEYKLTSHPWRIHKLRLNP
ncbi:MAG: hypothetical protein J6S21_00575, partial [Victivallales bacterium]|nr:hypothetical protein [Victivallales bacterium]